MHRIPPIATLIALFALIPTQKAEAVVLGGGVCNDTVYEADGDAELEINLYSSAVQEVWSCRLFHQVINATSVRQKQVFTVDYQAAGLYVGALAPLKSRLVESSSWKSCTSHNKPAQFTRVAPQPARTVSVATAPACSVGFALLDEIKQLGDYLGMAPSVDSILEETDEITGDSRELLVATTSFDQDSTGRWWEYRMLVESGFDNEVDLRLDGPWTSILGMPVEFTLQAGGATELLLRVPVGAVGDEPMEYREVLEFDDGREEFGTIPVSVVAPVDLGERLRGDVDADGTLGMSDGMAVANFLFRGGEAPSCSDAADFNSDDRVDLADVIGLLHHLFLGSPAPEETTADCAVVRDDTELLITELGPVAPSQASETSSKDSSAKH